MCHTWGWNHQREQHSAVMKRTFIKMEIYWPAEPLNNINHDCLIPVLKIVSFHLYPCDSATSNHLNNRGDVLQSQLAACTSYVRASGRWFLHSGHLNLNNFLLKVATWKFPCRLKTRTHLHLVFLPKMYLAYLDNNLKWLNKDVGEKL